MPSSALSISSKLTITSLSLSSAEAYKFSHPIVLAKGVTLAKATTCMFVLLDDSYAKEGVVVLLEGEDIIDKDVKVVIPV